MTKIAVCDDQPIFINITEQMITKVLGELDATYSIDRFLSGEDLCSSLETGNTYDIVYLDISMGGMSGVETGDKLRHYFNNKKTILIYISSYDTRAKEVFFLQSHRFLSKPIDRALFKESLVSAIDILKNRKEDVFSFKISSSSHLSLPTYEIIYFGIPKSHRLSIITKEDIYNFYGKLSDIHSRLHKSGFLLIHHSFLINYSHIKQIFYDKVIMSNNETLPISGPKRKDIRKLYHELRKKDI